MSSTKHIPAPEFFTGLGNINPVYKDKSKQPTLQDVCDKLLNLGIYIEEYGESFWWVTGPSGYGCDNNVTYPMPNTHPDKMRTGLALLAGFAAAERFHNAETKVVLNHNLHGD